MGDAGALHVVLGSPGYGKTWHVLERLLPPATGPRRFALYSTQEIDDARRFRLGPVVRDLRTLEGKPCPRAVCLLGGADRGAQCIGFAQRIRAGLGYRVTVAIDEAHEVWPEPAPRDRTESFHTLRHQEGVTLIALSQWPAKLSKVLYRTALALGSVTWFGVDSGVDLRWIETEASARAALEVAELQPRRFRVIRAGAVPDHWRGLERLRAKAARGR